MGGSQANYTTMNLISDILMINIQDVGSEIHQSHESNFELPTQHIIVSLVGGM